MKSPNLLVDRSFRVKVRACPGTNSRLGGYQGNGMQCGVGLQGGNDALRQHIRKLSLPPATSLTCPPCKQIADFNLSKALQDAQPGGSASTSLHATNPIWLAPEVLEGGRATAASDVYSFALILWELLTWRLPWGGENPFRLAHLVRNGHRPAVPPPGDLPGPNNAAFAGLDAYCALMRCGKAGGAVAGRWRWIGLGAGLGG